MFTIAVRLTSSPAGDDDDIIPSPVRLLKVRGLSVCVGGAVHWRHVRLLLTKQKRKKKEQKWINFKVSQAKDCLQKTKNKTTDKSDHYF